MLDEPLVITKGKRRIYHIYNATCNKKEVFFMKILNGKEIKNNLDKYREKIIEENYDKLYNDLYENVSLCININYDSLVMTGAIYIRSAGSAAMIYHIINGHPSIFPVLRRSKQVISQYCNKEYKECVYYREGRIYNTGSRFYELQELPENIEEQIMNYYFSYDKKLFDRFMEENEYNYRIGVIAKMGSNGKVEDVTVVIRIELP